MSIAMKRILKVTFWVSFILLDIIGLAALANCIINGKYTVDTEQFETVIEWGDEVSLDEIKIIDNRVFGLVETTLTKDMIVSIDDTETAGKKKVVFEHNNKQFTVVFDVKYRVEFLSYGEVIDTQMVFSAEELNMPSPEPNEHYDFAGWDYDFAKGLSGNIQVNAVFDEIEYPELTPLAATYGDTLGDVALPSNDRGRWEFVYPADTPVGNAGKETFSVQFVFNEGEGKDYYRFDSVEIDVKKKQLDFTVGAQSFVYDGKAHFPTYTLPVDVEVITIGTSHTVPGLYDFSFTVNDENYEGEYVSSFEITRPTVTVTVSSGEIVYPAGVPEFTYTVDGFDNVDNMLGIEIVAPVFAQAGAYEIGITYKDNNVDYVINKGVLIVHKGDQEVPIPEYTTPTYGDKLSDIEFLGNYQGTWSWEEPDRVIDNMNGITAWAVFKYNDDNYNDNRVEIAVTGVKKKTLSINIPDYSYTYVPGAVYTLPFELSGLVGSDDASAINVIGNTSESAAGTFRKNLYIDDTRYDGAFTAELKIARAIPVTDFTTVFEIVWSENLTLGSITLPEGYAWVNPDYVITAGEHTCAAVYTPTETSNYENVSGAFTVKVAKAEVQLEGIETSYDKTYDTLKVDIKNSGIVAKYTDKAPVIKYYKDGLEVDEILNAGTYTILITVDEGTNYLAKTVELTVVISKKVNTETVKTAQTVNYGDPMSKLELPSGIEGAWSWQETEIGNAGVKTFTAVYTPDENGNYAERTVSVTVNVKKIAVDAPTVSDKEYTGGEIDTGFADTDIYTVSGDITATDAGNYSVTFTLRDFTNYEWIGYETVESVTRIYKISRALNSWKTEPENVTATYDGNPVYIFAEANHGTVSVVYTLNGVVVEHPTEAGVYVATITATDPNYDDFTAERTITINKQTVIAPTAASKTLVYNKTEQGLAVNDPYGKLDVLYTVDSEVRGTDAGSQLTLVLKLMDTKNYKWDTTDEAIVTLTGEIVKTVVSFKNETSVDKSTWTFMDTEGIVTAATVDDTSALLGISTKLLYSYNGGAFVTYDKLAKTNGRLNAGTYTVKTVVEATKNWDGIQTAAVTFTVGKATPNKITVSFGDSVKDAEGNYYKNLIKAPTYTVYYTYNGGSDEIAIELLSCTYGISAAGFAGADTKYTFKATPKDTVNFAYAEIDTTVPFVVVATIGSTMYGSIEDALGAAVSGDVVLVKADSTGNIKILTDVVIKSGVTLRLPYGSGANDYNTNYKSTLCYDNNKDEIGDAPAEQRYKEFRKTYVKLTAGKSITIEANGKLEVSGELSSGGYVASYLNFAGHTARYYALLELEAGAVINNNGTINALGYIRETSKNNGSIVYVNNGGSLYQPIVLRDYRTGNYIAAAAEYAGILGGQKWTHKFAPFTRFIFMNVSPTTKIEFGGKAYAVSNLYANSAHNNAVVEMIGNTGNSFIFLTAGHLLYKYDVDTEIMKLDFYGGATLQTLKISAGGLVGDVQSSKFTMALTYHYDITLNKLDGQQSDAVYKMTDEYKMLPGAKLTVEKGAVLEILKSMNIYSSDFVERIYKVSKDDHSQIVNEILHYPDGKGDAIFTVNGTLVANILGGKVHTNTDGAKILVTGSTSASSWEITHFYEAGGVAGAASGVSPTQYYEVVNKLVLYYGSNSVEAELGKDYASENGKWASVDSFEFTVPDHYDIEWTDESGTHSTVGLTGEDRTIVLPNNVEVTLILSKNCIYLDTSAISHTFASLDELKQCTDCTVVWKTSSSSLPNVYYVPAFDLSLTDMSSCKITYYNLDVNATGENSTAYAVIEATKTYTNNSYNVSVYVTVDGIAADKIEATSGAYESGKYTANADKKATVTLKITVTNAENNADISIGATTEDVKELENSGSTECITPDSMITLADGTQVRVDSLTGDEMLLVWNLETGKFDFAPIMFIDSDPLAEFEIIYLHFSDGTVVKVIYEHGFWDYDLNKYVYLDKNAADYIGHSFAKQSGDDLVKVQLVDVEIRTEMNTAWSPVTVGHLCYFVNGMLSMPGGVGGLFNIFEVDTETMTYDYEAMYRDIETYGLFTYEELNAICPLSEDMFNAAGGAYLKISIAKGNLTMDELTQMIERYSVYF